MNHNSFYIGATLRLPVTTPLSPHLVYALHNPAVAVAATVAASGRHYCYYYSFLSG